MNTALRDISEIDAVGWWPPGPGWWLIIAAVFLLLLFIRWFWPLLVSWLKHPRDFWRRDARRELMNLRKRLDRLDQKSAAAEFSELMRRIALARCGREACAGLSGDAWIEWLAINDPNAFDWIKHGDVLLKLAYAPPGEESSALRFRQLIDAAVGWTEATSCVVNKNG